MEPLIADITFSAEAIGIIGVMGTGLITAIALLFKLLMASKDRALDEMTTERNSYKQMAEEAIANGEKFVSDSLAKCGQPDFEPMAPVVPEHSSPVTRQQQDVAELQTLRARLVASTLAMKLPPRLNGNPPP